jgi:hypothetical protein
MLKIELFLGNLHFDLLKISKNCVRDLFYDRNIQNRSQFIADTVYAYLTDKDIYFYVFINFIFKGKVSCHN